MASQNRNNYKKVSSSAISELVFGRNCLGTVDFTNNVPVGMHEVELKPQGIVRTDDYER